MKAEIIKGKHKGKKANVTVTKKEFGEMLYSLSIDGEKIWNGSFTWFPSSFLKFH